MAEEFDVSVLGTPWPEGESLFDKIEAALNDDGELPELFDPAEPTEEGLRFAPGMLAGVTGGNEVDGTDLAKRLLKLLRLAVDDTDARAFASFYAMACEYDTLDYVDELAAQLHKDTRTYEFGLVARHMLKHAHMTNAVKVAMSITASCGDEDDVEPLLIAGTYEEFTLYAFVAIACITEDGTRLWNLASRVHGWGRIEAIRRFDAEFGDEEFADWMLHEGYRNTIMHEYTADICARRGVLAQRLASENVEERTLDAAADLLAALARGQPGAGMSGYAESIDATRSFIRHVSTSANVKIAWLAALQTISDVAAAEDDAWGMENWTHGDRNAIVNMCRDALDSPRCRDVITAGLKSEDMLSFNEAASVANKLGMDVWEQRFQRQLDGGDQWWWLLENADEVRVDRVLALAEKTIDLKSIATGPAQEMGLGPEFEQHMVLDTLLQAIVHFPGKGVIFLKTALRSPVTRNRWGAVRAVLAWPHDKRRMLDEDVAALRLLEPEDELVEQLDRVLAGEVDSSQ